MTLACASAVRLPYGFLLKLPESRDQKKALRATMFVFSHCKVFEYTRRRTVREAFEGRLSVSCKHKVSLETCGRTPGGAGAGAGGPGPSWLLRPAVPCASAT